MVVICYPLYQERGTPATVSSHQVNPQSFHIYPPSADTASSEVPIPEVQDAGTMTVRDEASQPDVKYVQAKEVFQHVGFSAIAEFISHF